VGLELTTQSFEDLVVNGAKVFAENGKIDTHIGGGLHPTTAALWCYLLGVQKLLGVDGDLLEIGGFKGWGLFIPSQFCAPNQRLIMADISEESLNRASEFIASHSRGARPDLLKVHGDSAKVNVLDTAFGARELRWAHIDGEHSYGALRSDLNVTTRHCGIDAMVCVDDVDYAEGPALNDCLRDWLDQNRDWRLVLRGFNKAYLVCTRSRIPWRRYLSFLPEVLERYFGQLAMLCSQTRSCESDYYAVTRRPEPNIKYMAVNTYFESLDDFEGFDPRSLIIKGGR
jgi:hypothetical protein